MKILTPAEEAAHNRAVWEGGMLGALGGLAIGSVGVFAARARFPAFRGIGLPLQTFLVTSSTTAVAVIYADRYSRNFEKKRHADSDYVNQSEQAFAQMSTQKSPTERAKNWVSENRYPIVFGSWAASMGIAFGLVNRNQYLTGAQKLVQARVYAQGLTLLVLLASFGLESNDLRAGKGRWETVKVIDPNDPEHKRIVEKKIHHEAYTGEDQWMDMIEAEEQKRKSRGESVRTKKQKQEHKEEEKHKEGEYKEAQKQRKEAKGSA